MNKKTGCKNNTDAITKEALDAKKEKKNLHKCELKKKIYETRLLGAFNKENP